MPPQRVERGGLTPEIGPTFPILLSLLAPELDKPTPRKYHRDLVINIGKFRARHFAFTMAPDPGLCKRRSGGPSQGIRFAGPAP